MNSMTREELDRWLLSTAERLKPDAETALAGDIAETIEHEIEAIKPRVSPPDRSYFNDQLRDVMEALACIRAGRPDASSPAR